MSRARSWTHPDTGEEYWFDVHDSQALEWQLELLSDVLEEELDDLLDSQISQSEAIFRLNEWSELIPPEGLRKKRPKPPREPAVCRICPGEGWICEGRVDKHHFVPKWIMLELEEYEKYAPRPKCTIQTCLHIHKFLHKRHGNGQSKSIAKYLTDEEKAMAHHLIAALRQERPHIYALIAEGDKTSYEWQLIHDWRRGMFDVEGQGKEPFPRWQRRISQ